MRKRVRRKQPKRPRRKDEQSLYFLIERDFDRETFLAEHDGWYSQVSVSKGVIDYAVRYGDRVLGIEVKSGFPKRGHFQQVVSKYRDSFDALYLAYPSDRAAEAFSIGSGRSSEFSEIGIISIALYRTHCIRRALVVERENSDAWDVFDEGVYQKEITEYVTKKKAKIIDSILSDEGHIRLTERDWRSLALLYRMCKATSIDRFHSVNELWKKHCKDLKWKGNVNYSNLLSSGFVLDHSYGVMLSLFNLTHEAYYRKRKIESRLKEELGVRRWKQLVEQSRTWRSEHRRKQKDLKEEILRTQ